MRGSHHAHFGAVGADGGGGLAASDLDHVAAPLHVKGVAQVGALQQSVEGVTLLECCVLHKTDK